MMIAATPALTVFLTALATALLLGCNAKTDSRPAIRILTAGIRHESNTFSPHRTRLEDLEIARGNEALKNQPWAEFLRQHDVTLLPTLHAHAQPFGEIDRGVYEMMKTEVLEGAKAAGKVDGIYLDFHGAMHVEGYPDAQVDLIDSLRQVLGPEPVVAASFDLHGNISEALAGRLNILTAYRTAPHVDQDETRVRAVRLLRRAIEQNKWPRVAHIQIPILIPGEKGVTGSAALAPLYARLPEISRQEGLWDASIFVGFAWADLKRVSMSVQVVAEDEGSYDLARAEAGRLAAALWERRGELKFDVETDTIEGAIRTALAAPEKTVFITDSGDNTTAGAGGDSTIVLEHLLRAPVRDAVIAGIVDPEAVEACEQVGVGKRLRLTLGGKLDTRFSRALTVDAIVERLPAAGGKPRRADAVDRFAVLRTGESGGVRVVVIARRRSFTSPEDFADVGIDPLAHKIVVVKLGYLFQALRDISPRTIMALTPGQAAQAVEQLPYEHLRRPIYPLDPDITWAP